MTQLSIDAVNGNTSMIDIELFGVKRNNATINQATDAKLNQAIDSHEDQHNTPQKKAHPGLALTNNTPPAAT